MQKEIRLNNSDLLIMNLVHYFITEENYNPVVLHGVNDEIWLENMDKDYKLVRIVSHYIHNNEQLNFDKLKVSRILDNLKKKTFTLNMPVVNIYTSLGDGVTLTDENNTLSVLVNKLSDIKNEHLLEIFPDIVEKTKHEEKGVDLFMKISEDINQQSFNKSKRIEKIFSMKEPIITYTIMAVCIFLFLFLVVFEGNNIFEISADSLVEFGGNVGYHTKNGEIFRLFSAVFLHSGLIHLLCNMYSLYVIGPQVESFYGKLKYALIFIISGVTGCILSLVFSPLNVVSVGASGALFGILGAICYFGYHYRVYLGNVLKSQIIPIIGLNLFIGFMVSGIDNFAHIGGLIGGIFTAMAVGVPDKSSRGDKISGAVLLFVYIAFITYMAFFK